MRSHLPTLFRWGVSAAIVALAGACVQHNVRVDYDPDANFLGRHSYAWVDSTSIVRNDAASPFLERRVRRAIDQAMTERGFAIAASGARPDILVTAFVVGPTAAEERAWNWSTAPCGPVMMIRIGPRDPFWGYGMRPWPWRTPYARQPWGYACGYRVGFGYAWIPLYQQPPRRLAGTLVVDIIDPTTRVTIWRGERLDAVSQFGGQGGSQEHLDAMAREVLREFPPARRP